MAKAFASGGISLTIVGDREWRATLKGKHKELGEAVERGIERGLILLQGDMMKRTGGTGLSKEQLAKYNPVPKPQPPAVLWRRSSTLHGSFHYTIRRKGLATSGQVGTPVEYAVTHELGLVVNTGRATIKMPRRPFVAPSLEENRDEVLAGIRREMDSVLR